MSSLDQFETEPSTFFSGSYLARVVFGDPLAEGFSFEGNQRAIAVSKIGSDKGEAYFSQAFVPYYIVDGYASGSFAGRVQRFSRLQCESETYFDSFAPNPIEIHLRNTSEIAWFGGAFPISGGDRWEIYAQNSPVDVEGAGGLVPIWAVESNAWGSGDDRFIDDLWRSKFPFESRYKGIDRLVRFRGRLPTPYTSSLDINGTAMTPSSSSNQISALIAGFNGGIEIVPAYGYLRKPGEPYPWRGTSARRHVGTVPPRVFLEFYFGIGDGSPDQQIYERGPSYRTFPPPFTFLVRSALLRGFRYGLYRATPSRTSCVFRYNRFGQMRDMLEQRQYAKFVDSSRGSTVTTSPVTVTFVTGTLTFARSVDYVTATNPSYNSRDSGIYDLEYKAGQPFFEV